MGSYQLSSQAPTHVEVELGCDKNLFTKCSQQSGPIETKSLREAIIFISTTNSYWSLMVYPPYPIFRHDFSTYRPFQAHSGPVVCRAVVFICVQLCQAVSSCVLLYSVVSCCVLFCPVVSCCIVSCCFLLCPFVYCCVLLCPAVSSCVQLCPDVSSCIMLRQVVSSCIMLRQVLSSCVKLSPVVISLFLMSAVQVMLTLVECANSKADRLGKPSKKNPVKLGTLSQQGGRVPVHSHLCPNLENHIFRIP